MDENKMYLGGQGHEPQDVEDAGNALLWPTVIGAFVVALVIAWALGGCAPAPAPAAHAPTWCEDCAVSGGGR